MILRALAYAVVVRAILVAINHGDAVLGGEVDVSRWLRIGFTVLVSCCVSTASSVGAILERQPCESAIEHQEAVSALEERVWSGRLPVRTRK